MVSKLVKVPLEAFQKIALQNYENQIELLRIKRTKVFNKLEMKIRILCLKGWKSYKDIVEETSEKYDYVKKVMDKHEGNFLISKPAFQDGKPTKEFKTDISKELKSLGITRFPCCLNGKRTTEPMFRNFLYIQSQKFAKRVNNGQ